MVTIMRQGQLLIDALKSQLKAHNITYKEVSRSLQLSEASIKRLLNTGNISLERLEVIANLARCSLSDLMERTQHAEPPVTVLSLEQEREIARDLPLLMVAVSVISGFSYEDLLNYYTLDEYTLIQKLAHLDRLKLIELQPGNRIRRRIAPNFHWLPDGPIQQFFLKHVAQEFFASKFNRTTEKLLVFNGLCSATINKKIQEKMNRFLAEIAELVREDKHTPMNEKYGTTLVLGLRQWQFAQFKTLQK